MVGGTRVRVPWWSLMAVVFAALAGCATPGPIVRLDPRSHQDITWIGGRASMTQERVGIRVATAFEHQDGDALGVRLEVQNQTEGRLEIGPRQITFMTCPGPAPESCGLSRAVVDPEAVLAALDEKQSVDRANAINDQRFYTSMVLLSAVGDVASIANGRASSTTGLRTAAVVNQAHNSAEQHDTRMQSIAAQRDVWSNVALRRNTLAPGAGAGGLIYLPIVLDARYVWVHVRVGAQVFPFGFEQTVRRIAPPARSTRNEVQ
jgi:hypothetical protein